MNNVQSLHGNKKRRGRPKSKALAAFADLFQVQSRSALYVKMRAAAPGLAAKDMGLVDEHFRDVATKRRMNTKLSELGRIFEERFWDGPAGKAWLKENWQQFVSMTAPELIAWVRANNPRAKVNHHDQA
jgi:hypothetical protein